jgi:tRNA(Ile2)-agmatinylcytidine synthase
LIEMLLHVGIDDTDSKQGMCTTYVAAVIVSELKRAGIELVGYPRLIRLNPNAPWKTRGNCAIALTVETDAEGASEVKKIVLKRVEELAELDQEGTTPGVVFYQGERIPQKLEAYSKRVVQDIVTIEEAEELAEELGAEVHKFKLGRGIIGALAAIGNTLKRDRTYELVAYRTTENWGTPRRVDARSVAEMDSKTSPRTFDNLDPATGEVRITPHTPCPVLYGVRATGPEAALEAHEMVGAEEPIECHVLFETNQGTDEHLVRAKIGEVNPLRSVIVDGEVLGPPRVIPGGHVIFKIKDGTGEIDCAAYEPTRQFRSVVKRLAPGDRVRAYGGAKLKPGLPLTINLEKISILHLAQITRKINPSCASCGRRMKSAGKDKGYVCKRCKTKLPPKSARIVKVPREIEAGLHAVPPRARRHLAKPPSRELLVRPPIHEF